MGTKLNPSRQGGKINSEVIQQSAEENLWISVEITQGWTAARLVLFEEYNNRDGTVEAKRAKRGWSRNTGGIP